MKPMTRIAGTHVLDANSADVVERGGKVYVGT